MGFESKVAGYISASNEKTTDELINQIESYIQLLPELKNDDWPFLPREIFAISYPKNNTNKVPITYRSVIIHFGMSIKELDDKLQDWLIKYEKFLKNFPGANESIVNIQLIPYTSDFKHNHLSFWWHKEYVNKSNEKKWEFNGDIINLFRGD